MGNDVNSCHFIGRLGANPEVKYMPNGNAVCNFSIANNLHYKDGKSSERVNQTTWINIVAFSRLAEVVGEYLSKGSQVYIEGSLRTRKWQDKSGNDRYTTEVIASELQMLGGGAQEPQQQQRQKRPAPQQPAATQNDFDDDIPF